MRYLLLVSLLALLLLGLFAPALASADDESYESEYDDAASDVDNDESADDDDAEVEAEWGSDHDQHGPSAGWKPAPWKPIKLRRGYKPPRYPSPPGGVDLRKRVKQLEDRVSKLEKLIAGFADSVTTKSLKIGSWVFQDENKIMVLRDTSDANKDNRFAFFPGLGNGINVGKDQPTLKTNAISIGSGWLVQQEGTFFVIRDVSQANQDHRYAFAPRMGNMQNFPMPMGNNPRPDFAELDEADDDDDKEEFVNDEMYNDEDNDEEEPQSDVDEDEDEEDEYVPLQFAEEDGSMDSVEGEDAELSAVTADDEAEAEADVEDDDACDAAETFAEDDDADLEEEDADADDAEESE